MSALPTAFYSSSVFNKFTFFLKLVQIWLLSLGTKRIPANAISKKDLRSASQYMFD